MSWQRDSEQTIVIKLIVIKLIVMAKFRELSDFTSDKILEMTNY